MYALVTPPDSLVQSRLHDSHVKPTSYDVVTLNQPNSNPFILAIHTSWPDN